MNETITWIDVTDELPDEGLEVLVVSTSDSFPVWVGYIEDSIWRWANGVRVPMNEITHWAEMPNGPEVTR